MTEPAAIYATDRGDETQAVPWCCLNCGRTLGIISRNTSRVPELTIVHAGMVVRVTMGAEVTCPACDRVRVYQPDKWAIERIMERRRR